MDRRLFPANERVALRGLMDAPPELKLVDPVRMSVKGEVVDLCVAPNGMRDRQLVMGETVDVLEQHLGWSFVVCTSGFVGYVEDAAFMPNLDPTHFVATAATHAFISNDMKSQPVASLPFGARLLVIDERKKFFETNIGFIPKSHLRSLSRPLTDPVAAAQLHFGVPYLWGGNSTRGIDCSGLIADSFAACGQTVPGDSDLQCEQFGKHLALDEPLQRGDLMFWEGHVGIMVDSEVMLHANAHHMACRYEPIEQAKLRIKAQGDGNLIAVKRVG